MNKTVRILVKVIIICSVVCYDENYRKRREADVSKLNKFVSQIPILIRLTNGIAIQSDLSEDPAHYLDYTSSVLKKSSNGFVEIQNLAAKGVLADIDRLRDAVKKVKTTSDLDKLSSFMTTLHKLLLDVKKDTTKYIGIIAKNYIENLNSLRNCEKPLEPFEKDTFTTLQDCIRNEKTTDNCYKVFHFISVQNGSIFKIDDKMESLLGIEKCISASIGDFKSLSNIWKIIKSVYMLFDTSFSNTQNLIRSAAVDITKYTEILDQFPENFGGNFKMVYDSEIKWTSVEKKENLTVGLPNGVRDLNVLLKELKGKYLLEIVGGKQHAEKLELALDPLRSFIVEMNTIEKGIANLEKKGAKDFTTAVSALVGNVQKGRDSAARNLPETNSLTKCGNYFEKPSYLNVTEHEYLFNYTDYIIKQMETFRNKSRSLRTKLAEALGKASIIADTAEKQLQGDDSKDQKLLSLYYNLKIGLKLNSEKDDISEAYAVFTKSLANDLEVLVDLYNTRNLRNHPDTTILLDLEKIVTDSKIVKTVECLQKDNFNIEQATTVLDSAHSLKALATEDAAVQSVRNYLQSIVDIQTALQNVEKLAKRLKKTDKINDFGDALKMTGSLVKGLEVLRHMTNTLSLRAKIEGVIDFRPAKPPQDVLWAEWEETGKKDTADLLKKLADLDGHVHDHFGGNLSHIKSVFEEAGTVGSVSVKFDKLLRLFDSSGESVKATEVFSNVTELDLEFSKGSYLSSCSMSVSLLQQYFEDMFSEEPDLMNNVDPADYTLSIVVWVGLITILITILILLSFSLTATGRNYLKHCYVSRCSSGHVRELYWRYSYFLDQESEKSGLCEAVREINLEQVAALLKKGVYVNVYNSFGNTPLHAATKYGHTDIVRILIKNGADRDALNTENKVPEQLIGENPLTVTKRASETTLRSSHKELPGSAHEIEKIYEKYRQKVFRQRLPELLPTMSYRIRVDKHLTASVVDKFTETYKGNVTDQKTGVTHFIVPTGSDGVFASDDFNYIMCVFLPTILMKEEWMAACLQKKSAFRDDYKFRVENVKYKGRQFDTVVRWSTWIHKQMLPFLYGVQIHVAIKNYPADELGVFRQLVEMHGATWCDEVPYKRNYNVGSHPYHHYHLGPLFVIYDGKTNFNHLKTDPDKMYTVLTFDEFVIFMLRFEVFHDAERKVPIPVPILMEKEDTDY